MIKLLGRLSKICEYIADVITVVLVVFITILIFVNVIFRFLFNNPIIWQYEATLVCMSWVVFIGMSMTTAHKEHMKLTFILGALKPKVRLYWENVLDIILIVFMIIGIVKGIEITQSTWSQMYQTIPVKKGIFYMAFPIGAAFSLLHLVYHVLNRKTDDFKTEDEEAAKIAEEVG